MVVKNYQFCTMLFLNSMQHESFWGIHFGRTHLHWRFVLETAHLKQMQQLGSVHLITQDFLPENRIAFSLFYENRKAVFTIKVGHVFLTDVNNRRFYINMFVIDYLKKYRSDLDGFFFIRLLTLFFVNCLVYTYKHNV